jgi:hypothetical protein
MLLVAVRVYGAEATGSSVAVEHTMASVFIMSCMQFAGSPPRLRTWMEGQHMTRAPDEVAKQYSGGKPGQVYGTRQLGGALLMVSLDDGGCTMIVERAKATIFRDSLEGALANAKAVIKLVKDDGAGGGRPSALRLGHCRCARTDSTLQSPHAVILDFKCEQRIGARAAQV